ETETTRVLSCDYVVVLRRQKKPNHEFTRTLDHPAAPGSYLISFIVLLMPGTNNDKPSSFPEWIQPMAATLTQERFSGPEWSFEQKFDGVRLLAYKRGAEVN